MKKFKYASPIEVDYRMIGQKSLNLPPIRWPQKCACCMSVEAGQSFLIQTQVTYTDDYDGSIHRQSYFPISMKVPYCETCLKHRERNKNKKGRWIAPLVGFLFLVFNAIGIISSQGQITPLFTAVICLTNPILWFFIPFFIVRNQHKKAVKEMMTPQCAVPGQPVGIWSDEYEKQQKYDIGFTFHNDEYAMAFAALNPETVIEEKSS